MSVNTPFGTGSFGAGPLGSSPFYDIKGVIDAVLYATGHGNPTAEVTKRNAILNFINNRYQEICMGRFWRWLQSSYDFTFFAPYEVGTFTATQGSDTIVGYGTQWSTNLIGQSFQQTGINASYTVKAVTSPTTIQFESAWAEATVPVVYDSFNNPSGETYTIAINTYQLPSDVDQVKSIVCDSTLKLRLMGVEDFRVLQQVDPLRLGRPQVATLVGSKTSQGTQCLQFYPAPDQNYHGQFDYAVRVCRLDDLAGFYPAIPDQFRAVLYYGALADFYTYLRDPVNAQMQESMYMRFLNSMKNDIQLTEQNLVFVPARKRTRLSKLARFPISISAEDFGRID